jgi:hypothetical protein
MLKGLAEVCFRRRRRVLLLWILGIVVLGAVLGAVGSGYRRPGAREGGVGMPAQDLDGELAWARFLRSGADDRGSSGRSS